jgi:catechol 2,3-dioxygenase-like lactoylglutathione lyase family enzyme
MFDHIGFVATDLDRAKVFYDACLGSLGINLLEDNTRGDARWLVYGGGPGDHFLVVSGSTPTYWKGDAAPGNSPIHLALVAPDVAAVDAFYSAGMANGGTDNGAPGTRDGSYTYYAAYLIDPDGNNIEAGIRG